MADVFTCVTVVTVVREAEALLRFLALSLAIAPSAWSARSSDSSSSCWTLRYLARLIAASSSCRHK